MKSKMLLLVGIMVLALGLVGTPASWANTLTFQGVTFNLNVSGTDLIFEVNNTLSATGDWTGIDDLDGFQIKQIGLDPANVTLTLSGFGVQEEVSFSANGCGGGNTQDAFCFTPSGGSFLLADDNTFTIKCTGTCNYDLTNNSVQVLFSGADVPNGHGSLLSKNIPGVSVPEPASLLLLGAGLAGIGIWRRQGSKV